MDNSSRTPKSIKNESSNPKLNSRASLLQELVNFALCTAVEPRQAVMRNVVLSFIDEVSTRFNGEQGTIVPGKAACENWLI